MTTSDREKLLRPEISLERHAAALESIAVNDGRSKEACRKQRLLLRKKISAATNEIAVFRQRLSGVSSSAAAVPVVTPSSEFLPDSTALPVTGPGAPASLATAPCVTELSAASQGITASPAVTPVYATSSGAATGGTYLL